VDPYQKSGGGGPHPGPAVPICGTSGLETNQKEIRKRRRLMPSPRPAAEILVVPNGCPRHATRMTSPRLFRSRWPVVNKSTVEPGLPLMLYLSTSSGGAGRTLYSDGGVLRAQRRSPFGSAAQCRVPGEASRHHDDADLNVRQDASGLALTGPTVAAGSEATRAPNAALRCFGLARLPSPQNGFFSLRGVPGSASRLRPANRPLAAVARAIAVDALGADQVRGLIAAIHVCHRARVVAR